MLEKNDPNLGLISKVILRAYQFSSVAQSCPTLAIPWSLVCQAPLSIAFSRWAPISIECCIFSSVAQLCLTLCNPTDCGMPDFPVHHNYQSLLTIMSIEPMMPSNHLIFCHSLLLLPSIFSSIRGFSNESALHIRWPKFWSFSFSISLSSEFSGLNSFRMDWLDLLQSKGLWRVFSNTTVQKHQVFGVQLSSQSNSDIHTWPLEKWDLCWQSNVSAFQYAI